MRQFAPNKTDQVVDLLDVDSYRIRALWDSDEIPGHVEQVDNLIRFVGRELDRIKRPSGRIVRKRYALLRAAIGALHERDVGYIAEGLQEQGLVTIDRVMINTGGGSQTRGIAVGLTLDGWDRYRELTMEGTKARIAFMAMQYRNPVLDKMYEDCFRPAIAHTGFELRRLDQVPKAGVIDNLLRAEILNSRFLLADLTHGNPGAYWEAGYAEGLGKPVIYLCEKSVFDDEKKRPHFDTNHCQTVVWNAKNLDECATQLKVTVRVTLPSEAKQTDD